jgi:curved DNA-binding protein CbpA
MIKKIDDLDYYELLNLRDDASPKEIEKSYLLAVATYHRDSLASYGVLGEKERSVILDRVEEAFQTLSNSAKRKAYDSLVRGRNSDFREKAAFRRSTRRLLIEDAEERESLWDKIKSIVSPVRRRREKSISGEGGDGNAWRSLSDGSFYYGEYLKKVRETRGLSLEDMARRCGVERSRLESLEEEATDFPPNGEKNLEVLRCYAKCLGLDSDDGRDSPFPTRFH